MLGAGSLASVAYGEIGSSIYFALGVVALYALGATPWVLLGVGALFLLVALSYAEGTSALPETGGAATFVRRAFNDPAGFITGWALFLDYLIVIALAGLFVPHYLGTALGWDAVTDSPWDVVFGVVAILGVAGIRLVRRARMYTAAIFIAVLAFLSHLLIIGLGFAFLLSREGFGKGIDLGTAPTWHALVFSLSLAMLAFTGLETVANLAAEAREPGKALPRSLFAGIGVVVIVSFPIAAIGLSAYPPHPDPAGPDGWATDLGTTWIRAPLVGISEAFGGSLPDAAVDTIKVFLGVTGAIILVSAIATSLSGAGRLAYSLGQRAMLPRSFGRLNQRTFIAPASIVSGAVIAAALLVIADSVGREVTFLASLYSFGALIAFTAAQLAVIRLRFKEPDLARPYRVPVNVRIRGVPVPLAPLIGAPLTFALWIAALYTHDAARIAGPVWLVLGAILFVAVRRARHERLLEHVEPAVADLVPEEEGIYERILVPGQARPDRRGDARDRDPPRGGARLRGPGAARDQGPARPPARRRADRRGGEGRGLARRGEAARSRARGGGRGRDRARARHRRGDRRAGRGRRRRPHPHGLRPALAAPVALLQPDRGLRAPPCALRGDGRHVSPGRPRGIDASAA